jgi:hypothetical protein
MSDAETKPGRPTIWTAAAASEVPLLSKLDMHARPSGVAAAKERAAHAKAKIKTALGSYVSRSTAESLRKLVK